MTTIQDVNTDELQHFGVLGMHWGKRKNKYPPTVSKTTNQPTEDDKKAATRKKILIGAGVAAAILAGSAAAYIAYDQHKLKDLKESLKISDLVFNRASTSPQTDVTIQKGSEFIRRSFDRNGAWRNPLRTYVVDSASGAGLDLPQFNFYGDKVFKFRATKNTKLAGLTTQLDKFISPKNNKAIREALSKDYAKYSISGRNFITKKLSKTDIAKLTLEKLRISAWDGGEEGINAVQLVRDILVKDGYSAVSDLNLPGTSARILLDKSSFVNI